MIGAKDVDGAREEILSILRDHGDKRVIYYHGWSGLGASAVLRSTPELPFDRIIHIDCSEWKGRRAMQRAIAEEMELDSSVMAILAKQDEKDDFNGVEESSRNEVTGVSRKINQILKDSRFVLIFHNGSDDEIDLYRCGVPPFDEFSNNRMIWTFRRRLLTMKNDGEVLRKLRYTDTLLFASGTTKDLSSDQFYALLCEEAAVIVARYPCMRGIINPAMVADCCLYQLFLHYSCHNSTKFDWAAHASNLWICDGIMPEDTAREITNALDREIRSDFSIDGFGNIVREFMKPHSFLVIKNVDDYPKDPCRRISITSRELGTQTIAPETSSLFLAFEGPDPPTSLKKGPDPPPAIPIGFFGHSSNLGVLILSRCAFYFASPPFLQCHRLRFLGLHHCKDDNTREGEGHTEWARLNSLWVLDLRYTDWDEILSEEKMDLMTNLWELNIEGVRCWQYTSQLQGRVPCLHRLRIIKPTCGPEKSRETSNSFLDKAKLEILDLSGNREMDILPSSLSKASSLQVLVLDGCNGLQDVVVPDGLPHLLRSFSFDGYGPASHWTPTKNSRPTTVDSKDVKISKISLEGCTQLDNLFLRGLPNLVELDLSGTAIKTLDFKTMVVEVSGLKRLFLLGCEHLRAIIWGMSDSHIQPDLELLCIDTRPGIGRPRPSSNQNKSFRLQVHAIIVDARLARSLWSPIKYHKKKNNIEDVYFNICVTSSPLYSGVDPSDEAGLQQLVPAGRYTDVFTKVLDAPMQSLRMLSHIEDAFPQPPTPQSDRHIEIAQGSRSVESELDADSPHRNLGCLIRSRAESLHVHDVSTRASMPGGDWEYYLRRCHVERCPKLDTVFPSMSYNFVPLENFWASDLLMARCIWSKGDSSFENLQHLNLRSCPRLQFVLPVWVSSFPSLETLHIIHCGDLRHVFVLDEGWSPEEMAFPKLTTIHLHDLPTLQQICEVKMVAPALEIIRIRGCWGLRRLPAVAARGQDEKKLAVEIEKDVWDALEWDGVDAGHDPDLFEAPIHSRYYKKKLPRVSVLSIRYGLMVALTFVAKLATCLKH